MKKLFYFLMTLIMLVSCTDKVLIDYGYNANKGNSLSKDAPSYINFGTNFNMPKMTKAIINTSNDLQAYTYGVYAKVIGTPSDVTIDTTNHGYLIYNETLKYNNNDWVLDNNKHYYWPKSVDNEDDNDPALNFYSFGPRSIGDITKDNGSIKIPIAIKADEIDTSIKDLVYAYASNQTYAKNNTTARDANAKGIVNLLFEHQLSWIVFEAKTSTAFTTLTINSITVHVDNSTATFSFTPSTSIATVNDQTGNPTLTNNGTAINHVLGPKEITPLDGYVAVGSFVALPQAVSDSMTAIINYSAKIAGVTYANRTATVMLNAGGLSETGTVSAPWTVTNWQKGYKYIYRININWREILFSVSVNGWNDNTNADNADDDAYLIY